MRLERRLVQQELDRDRLAIGQHALAVLGYQTRVLQQRPCVGHPRRARTGAEPSETGGTNGWPNTSSETLPRNGSSKASSSALGLPTAINGEFWNTEWVRS